MPKKTTKKKVTKKKEEKQVAIPPIALKKASITLIGTSPLMVNKFSEKSKREMEDKATKKAKNKKEYGTPEEQMKATLYAIPGKKNVYGVPASGVKNCAITATRYVDAKGTVITGAFHVVDDIGGLIPIKGSKPVIDERIVRVGNFGNKKPCVRYRARFDKWELKFNVLYNSNVVSTEQLLHLYENAGFSVGLCEYRPEKKGNLGMFHVKRS